MDSGQKEPACFKPFFLLDENIIKEFSRQGISQYLLGMAADYFSDKYIEIREDTTVSMTTGIPQGSVLGPFDLLAEKNAGE